MTKVIIQAVAGIYKITSKIHPDRIYVGSAINIEKRWREHKNLLLRNKHENIRLQNHYNKYGKDNFIFSIITECDPIKEVLLSREQFFIDSLNPFFNICKKADCPPGIKHTEEQKRILSERMKGNKYLLGHKHSEETLKKMSETAKEISSIDHIFNKVSCKGQDHPWYNKKHSEKTKKLLSNRTKEQFEKNPEFRKILSNNLKKLWEDPEQRKNLILKNSGENHCWYGKKHTEEEKRKISESNKKAWVLRRVKKAS
jgi:group I intron endonuclease